MASRKQRRERQLARQASPLPPSGDSGVGSRTVTRYTEFAGYQGPLPPPQMLAEYEQLVPNGAERIFKVFESQAEHRMNLEKKALDADARRSDRGLLAGLVISVGSIAIGAALAANGQEASAAIFVGMPVAGLVTTFIYGTASRRSERKERMRQTAGRR